MRKGVRQDKQTSGQFGHIFILLLTLLQTKDPIARKYKEII